MSTGKEYVQDGMHWPMSNDELRGWFSRHNIPIQDLVQMWLHMDQNKTTKAEITQLNESKNTAELEKRLQRRIQFGTAGTIQP
jgi:hypothetical protein